MPQSTDCESVRQILQGAAADGLDTTSNLTMSSIKTLARKTVQVLGRQLPSPFHYC